MLEKFIYPAALSRDPILFNTRLAKGNRDNLKDSFDLLDFLASLLTIDYRFLIINLCNFRVKRISINDCETAQKPPEPLIEDLQLFFIKNGTRNNPTQHPPRKRDRHRDAENIVLPHPEPIPIH